MRRIIKKHHTYSAHEKIINVRTKNIIRKDNRRYEKIVREAPVNDNNPILE